MVCECNRLVVKDFRLLGSVDVTLRAAGGQGQIGIYCRLKNHPLRAILWHIVAVNTTTEKSHLRDDFPNEAAALQLLTPIKGYARTFVKWSICCQPTSFFRAGWWTTRWAPNRTRVPSSSHMRTIPRRGKSWAITKWGKAHFTAFIRPIICRTFRLSPPLPVQPYSAT